MSDKVITVEGLSKRYDLGSINSGTLTNDLKFAWAKLRGRENPNSIIGEQNKLGGEYWALNDVSFQIKKGESVGIIGKNGAGKSTLLKILSRVTAPTKGKIKIKGRIASLLEVGTGFHPDLTGRENIFMNGAILGMTRHEIAVKLDEIIAFSGVEKYIDTPVKRYSSGMYVRLAFAVAAHLESEILIVDEVLAVGDAEFQKKCLGKMGDISSKEGRTVLYVSHNISSVLSLCSHAIYLKSGQIIAKGNTQEITDIYVRDANQKKYKADLTKDVYINNIILTDINFTPKIDFFVGETICLKFDIGFKIPYENLNISIDIHNKHDELFAHISNQDDSSNILLDNINSSELTISMKILNINFVPDDYTLSIWLGNTFGTTYLYADHCTIFNLHQGSEYIKRTNPYPNHAKTILLSRWSYNEK